MQLECIFDHVKTPMKKKLNEMTLEELWQLFPIVLTEHRDCWADWFKEESCAVRTALASLACGGDGDSCADIRITHVGSTAVPGIWAKPIVDILAELPPCVDLRLAKAPLIAAGYICMSESENRISFNKGYADDGFAEKVFHLHLRHAGDNAEIRFRDFLRENSAVAKEYEALKLSLWKRFEHDRDGYTEAKSEFVCRYSGAK